MDLMVAGNMSAAMVEQSGSVDHPGGEPEREGEREGVRMVRKLTTSTWQWSETTGEGRRRRNGARRRRPKARRNRSAAMKPGLLPRFLGPGGRGGRGGEEGGVGRSSGGRNRRRARRQWRRRQELLGFPVREK